MELKTIKEFAHKNNLGEGLMYSNGVFKTNLDNEFNTINNKIAEISNTLTKVYKVKGSTSVDTINTMTIGNAMIGYVYNMLDSGIITNGVGGEFDVVKGDNIVYTEEGWDEFSVSLDLALRAGKNISIENDAINALGYTYNKEKESFSIGSGSATNQYSYAEGSSTKAEGSYSHAEGHSTEAFGSKSHAEGWGTIAFGDTSHTEGVFTTAGYCSHAEGSGGYSQLNNYRWELDSKFITFGSVQYYRIGAVLKIENNGESIFVKIIEISDDGLTVTVDNPISLECNETSILSIVWGVAYGDYSHSEGSHTEATGKSSHTEGSSTIAFGEASHAEGGTTKAWGSYSHVEGADTEAFGNFSHAEGAGAQAIGSTAHAEGSGTKASGYASHSEGSNTIANNPCEHAQGKCNVSNTGETENTQTIHSIGIGKSVDNRKNAQEVMVNGDYYIVGIGGYNGANINEEGVKTLQEVLNEILEKIS